MSGAICAICYEDARPTCEDLQSISACGHVFHELCLQQWMEYCPAGRKPTCPVCKQSCTARDVHRLYFQSAGADPTQLQGLPSRKAQRTDSDPDQVHTSPAVRKLEGQLAAAKAALQARNEQLKELDCQVTANLQRAEKAEAAYAEASRERVQCKQGLTRTQEELKRSLVERAMLEEKNLAMSKDLAAHKLVGDADLGEEEVFRLANVGSGSNKNIVIETLTKSLILRNKSYKELMARCNELGIGESRAVRKSEKTIEQLKKLKARVHELEKALEEKENAHLRGLSKQNSKVRSEDVGSGQRPLDIQNGLKRPSFPTNPPLERPAGFSTQSRSRITSVRERWAPEDAFKLPGLDQDLDVNAMSWTGPQKLPLLNIVKERGQMPFEHTQQACPDNFETVREEPQEACHSRKRGAPEDVPTPGQEATGFDPQRDDGEAQGSGFSFWKVRAQNLVRKIELLSKSLPFGDRAQDHEEHSPQVGQETGPLENGSSAVASPSTCGGQPTLGPSIRTPHPEVETGTPSPTSDVHRSGDRVPGSSSTAIGPAVNSFGAFAKGAPSGRPSSTPSSSFILSGADGRGGRVTILKPPSLSLGGVGFISTKKAKRPKVSGAGFSSRQGALQIEHFFGRAKS